MIHYSLPGQRTGLAVLPRSNFEEDEEEEAIYQNSSCQRGKKLDKKVLSPFHQHLQQQMSSMKRAASCSYSVSPHLYNSNNNNNNNNNSMKNHNNNGNGASRHEQQQRDEQNRPPAPDIPPPLPPKRTTSLVGGTTQRKVSMREAVNPKRVSIATSSFWANDPDLGHFVSGWEIGRDRLETMSSVWSADKDECVINIWGDLPAVKKGVVILQQRDKIWPRWKERYCILTRDYLHCFRRTTSIHRSGVRLSEMGTFIFKIRLADIETVEWETRKSGPIIAVLLPQDSRIRLRTPSETYEALNQWFTLLAECVYLSKERRLALRNLHNGSTIDTLQSHRSSLTCGSVETQQSQQLGSSSTTGDRHNNNNSHHLSGLSDGSPNSSTKSKSTNMSRSSSNKSNSNNSDDNSNASSSSHHSSSSNHSSSKENRLHHHPHPHHQNNNGTTMQSQLLMKNHHQQQQLQPQQQPQSHFNMSLRKNIGRMSIKLTSPQSQSKTESVKPHPHPTHQHHPHDNQYTPLLTYQDEEEEEEEDYESDYDETEDQLLHDTRFPYAIPNHKAASRASIAVDNPNSSMVSRHANNHASHGPSMTLNDFVRNPWRNKISIGTNHSNNVGGGGGGIVGSCNGYSMPRDALAVTARNSSHNHHHSNSRPRQQQPRPESWDAQSTVYYRQPITAMGKISPSGGGGGTFTRGREDSIYSTSRHTSEITFRKMS